MRGNHEGLDLNALVDIVAKANSLDMEDAKLALIVKTRINNALYGT